MSNIAIIVDSFQTVELPWHRSSEIDMILKASGADKLVFAILNSPITGTAVNPFSVHIRTEMLKEYQFISYEVEYISIDDHPSDEEWSENFDIKISAIAEPVLKDESSSIKIYGTDQGFTDRYAGIFDSLIETFTLKPDKIKTKQESIEYIEEQRYFGSEAFRAGIKYNALKKYPTSYNTVDIAIMSQDGTKILLGRKPNETLFRFIGGFVDPGDNYQLIGVDEDNARREVMEECSIEVQDFTSVTSMYIDDWRYRNEEDSIKTNLLRTVIAKDQTAIAADDIAEVKWFNFDKLKPGELVETHRNLFRALKIWTVIDDLKD